MENPVEDEKKGKLTARESDGVHHPDIERARGNDGIASERGSSDDTGGSEGGNHGDGRGLVLTELEERGRREVLDDVTYHPPRRESRTGQIGNGAESKTHAEALVFQSLPAR